MSRQIPASAGYLRRAPAANNRSPHWIHNCGSILCSNRAQELVLTLLVTDSDAIPAVVQIDVGVLRDVVFAELFSAFSAQLANLLADRTTNHGFLRRYKSIARARTAH